MAAATAKYYFQFRICWCHCLQKVKVYQQTKFRPDISIGGWYITTSGFEIQTSALLEFYFRYRSRQFCRNRLVILHPTAEFRPNRNIPRWNMTSYRFLRWRPSAMLYLLWGMAATHEVPYMVRIPSSNRYFVGLIFPEILRCKDFGVLAWNCLFTRLLESFWGIFSPYDVTHCPDPRKALSWAETRHLSHSA